MSDGTVKGIRPDGYEFELARAISRDKGEYTDWIRSLSRQRPVVPDGAVRSLRTLYALDSGPHENEPRLYGVYYHRQVGDADLVRLYFTVSEAETFVNNRKDSGNYEVIPLLVDTLATDSIPSPAQPEDDEAGWKEGHRLRLEARVKELEEVIGTLANGETTLRIGRIKGASSYLVFHHDDLVAEGSDPVAVAEAAARAIRASLADGVEDGL